MLYEVKLIPELSRTFQIFKIFLLSFILLPFFSLAFLIKMAKMFSQGNKLKVSLRRGKFWEDEERTDEERMKLLEYFYEKDVVCPIIQQKLGKQLKNFYTAKGLIGQELQRNGCFSMYMMRNCLNAVAELAKGIKELPAMKMPMEAKINYEKNFSTFVKSVHCIFIKYGKSSEGGVKFSYANHQTFDKIFYIKSQAMTKDYVYEPKWRKKFNEKYEFKWECLDDDHLIENDYSNKPVPKKGSMMMAFHTKEDKVRFARIVQIVNQRYNQYHACYDQYKSAFLGGKDALKEARDGWEAERELRKRIQNENKLLKAEKEALTKNFDKQMKTQMKTELKEMKTQTAQFKKMECDLRRQITDLKRKVKNYRR
tara:strand:- start:345 stop:1448 length:1104 start_codon:yes stop_codon:yes gene_type:complete